MSSITLPGFDIIDTQRQTSETVTVKAVQRSLDRTVALCFLRPERTNDPKAVQHFLSVARVCAQIKADGLPQIYDISSLAEQPYIVMEYVEGLSIAEIVRQNGPMSVSLSVRVALTIADVLNHAWNQNRLLHRNLKPSEIRIDGRGTPKLTDFGRAALLLPDGRPADAEEPGVIIGTPNFLSPELIQGTPGMDCRADIYALGATLYYMITGHIPFPDSDPETVIQKQLTDQIPHPRTYRPELTANICGLLSRLMMKLPQDRYADWTDAMLDMQLVLKNQPLRRREAPSKGISTVAAMAAVAETPHAPELPQLRKIDLKASAAPAPAHGPAAAVDTPPFAHANETPASGVGAGLRISLLLLLCIWFVLLGNARIGNPLRLALPSPLLPLATRMGVVQNARTPPPPPDGESQTQPLPPRAPPATTPAIAASEPPAATNTAPETAAAVAPAPAKQAEPAKPLPPAELPPEILQQLAAAFARGDVSAARAILAAQIPMDAAKLAEFRTAVENIPDPLKVAALTIEASRDHEIAITYNGKERKIIPHSVVNGVIAADFVSPTGLRPVTINISGFAPEELLQLLPPQPDTPALQASVCLALLKANRKSEIAAHVPSCGVLGPVLEAAAAAKAEAF